MLPLLREIFWPRRYWCSKAERKMKHGNFTNKRNIDADLGKRISAGRGFTLIELLIVLLLVGVTAVPLVIHFINSFATLEDVAHYQLSTSINTSQMEIYRNQPYRLISMITGELDVTPEEHRKKLSTKIKVQEIIPGKLLSIVVTTTLKTRKKSSLSLVTLVANQKPITGINE